MDRGRASLALGIILCVAGVMCLGRHLGLLSPAVSARSMGPNRRAPAPMSTELSRVLQAAEGVLLGAMDKMDPGVAVRTREAATGASPASSQSDCEWPPGFLRDADLADAFLMGSVTPQEILRSKVLNVADRAPCPGDVKALGLVLERYNRLMAPVLSAFRDLRAGEVEDLVSRGRIAEWVGAAASDGDVMRYEQMLLSAGRSNDDAHKEAEAARPSLGSRPPGSYVKLGGRYYPLPGAELLPLSADYYGKLKCVAIDQLQVIVAWFCSNGYVVDDVELAHLCVRIQSRRLE